MKPRRAKSAYFLMSVLTVNVVGCLWYILAPNERGESSSKNNNTLPVYNYSQEAVDSLFLIPVPNDELDEKQQVLNYGDDVDFDYQNEEEEEANELEHGLDTLVDLLQMSYMPKDSIFFLETSDKPRLFPLALCSLESAALHHPKKQVFLLRSTNGPTQWTREVNAVAAAYDNIQWRKINADRLVLETPLASLWNSDKLNRSTFSLSHTSDVLRVAVLYKFGGTYVDTDIITLSEHPSYEKSANFVTFEEPGSINGAMMRFQPKHPMLEAIGERLAQYFNPRKWASNGPRLLSTAFAAKCELDPIAFGDAQSLGPDDLCGDIRSYRPDQVFAVHYSNWKWFFQVQHLEEVLSSVQSSFASHIWGHFFKQEIQWDRLHQGQAFYHLSSQNCPTLFRTIVDQPHKKDLD